MNFLNLLTKEKSVAGIEISDSVIRIAFFHTQKNTKKISTKKQDKNPEVSEKLILIEEPIAADIIADGVVLDIDLLSKTLKNIWAKANLETNYAIVAIPDDKIYSKIFTFPKSITETRLSEAMRLAVSFQLPMKTEDIYLDWETLPGTKTTNEIFLSTIPRAVADGYMEAVEKAGIKTLALESHLPAIARAVKLPENETTIFSKKTPDGNTIFALKDKVLRFSRTLPHKFILPEQVPEELSKVKAALTTETDTAVEERDIAQAEILDTYIANQEIPQPHSKWLISLGAAIRGKMPEGTDNLVSLLPVGTEEAYAYQKATAFISFLRNLTVGISLFFIMAFLGSYLFMLSIADHTNEQVANLSAVTIPPELEHTEQLITDINNYTETEVMLLSQTPTWSSVVSELINRNLKGISISLVSLPSFTEKISITGIAENRTILNEYEAHLKESPMFTEVLIPLNYLEKKNMIPFTASFRLKEPDSLYYINQTH